MFQSKNSNKVEYTEKFKNEIINYINQGLTYTEIANKMGVDWFDSKFREMYYRLERNESMGTVLPSLDITALSNKSREAKGVSKKSKRTKPKTSSDTKNKVVAKKKTK